MRFAFTAEQEELRQTVRTLVERHGGPVAPPPESPCSDYDAGLWRKLAGEIGAAGLAIPEHHGGAGFSLLESTIVAEELGRRLVVSPFLGGAVLSAETLMSVEDTAACTELLPGIAAGDSVVALAWAESEAGWSTTGCATVARRDGDTWLLDGTKLFVLDGARADVVLVVADTGRGPSLFRLVPEAAAASTRSSAPLDHTRPLTELVLQSAAATLVGREGQAGPALERCRDVAATALAAEQVGAAGRWLHEIVEYVKLRKQFGRAIGSFQAIKHRLADLYVAVESARSLSYAASWAVATRAAEASTWSAMAKSHCGETYSEVATEGIQLHGGIGITWEHEAHLHLKRAQSSAQLFGTPRISRQRLEPLLFGAHDR